MMTINRFVIRNDHGDPATLDIEPEGMFVTLESGKEVVVIDKFSSQPVTVTLDKSAEGRMLVSIWPDVRVVIVKEERVDLLGRDSLPSALGEARGQAASVSPVSVR